VPRGQFLLASSSVSRRVLSSKFGQLCYLPTENQVKLFLPMFVATFFSQTPQYQTPLCGSRNRCLLAKSASLFCSLLSSRRFQAVLKLLHASRSHRLLVIVRAHLTFQFFLFSLPSEFIHFESYGVAPPRRFLPPFCQQVEMRSNYENLSTPPPFPAREPTSFCP